MALRKYNAALCASVVALLGLLTATCAQPVQTVAGTGTAGFSGDGGPAKEARLAVPAGIAVDAKGTLYICDSGNARIRIIDASGTIETIAGIGIPEFSGDGGPAVEAQLSFPTGIAVSSDGSIYVADTDNHRIRRIAPDGTITTTAGTGNQGFSGDGGPAAAAELSNPTGIALDSKGNLYIADFGNSRIRKVSVDGVISTVAGSSSIGYDGDGGPATKAAITSPYGVAVLPPGELIFTDFSANVIRAVSPEGIITTLAGTGVPGFSGDGGPSRQAALWNPAGVAAAPDGTIYFADSGNNRIRAILPNHSIVTVAGSGQEEPFNGDGVPAETINLSAPTAVAVSGSKLLFTDDGHHRVCLIDLSLAVIYGDLNSDSAVTTADAVLALKIALNMLTPSPKQSAFGDVAPKPGRDRYFGDGAITVADVVRILRCAIGLEPSWP